MGRMEISDIIMISVGLMVVAIIFPIALGLLGGAGNTMVTVNGTSTALSELVDPSVLTLLTVLLPIIGIIIVVIGFLRYFDYV